MPTNFNSLGHPCNGCTKVIGVNYQMIGCSKQSAGGIYPYWPTCPGKEEFVDKGIQDMRTGKWTVCE